MDQLQPFSLASASSSDHNQNTQSNTDAAPLDRPSFTFIDHDDDLTSKRIKDVNARKAIRSHVMRDVRRRERLAGLKRTSRRESRGQPVNLNLNLNLNSDSGSQDNSTEQPRGGRQLVLRSISDASDSKPTLDAGLREGFVEKYQHGRPVRRAAGYPLQQLSQLTPVPRSLPTSWFIDPFCTLPGMSEMPAMVAHLLYYWKSVFVPVTFPNENKGHDTKEVELMIRTSFSDPGSFFGLMSMCAAHRAVLSVEYPDTMYARPGKRPTGSDPEYCMTKARCIREMNAKVCDPRKALSNEAFDTIVNLLSGSLIAGLFDEARIHLTGLRRMVELRGGITDESIRSASMLVAIITADVKAGSGLLVKPLFPLTWDPQPIPIEIQQRIRPPSSTPLHQLGSGFFANNLLSPALLEILSTIRDLIFYGVADPLSSDIKPSDHHFFRILNCEAEHKLLSYIYKNRKKDTGSKDTENPSPIHPIESIARVATICYLNNFLIVSPASSGLGRALTKHLLKALSKCKLSNLLQLPKENLGLFAWALVIGARGSVGQVERSWFMERLARVAMICKWSSWQQFSRILCDYFFVPDKQGKAWQAVWDEAMSGYVVAVKE